MKIERENDELDLYQRCQCHTPYIPTRSIPTSSVMAESRPDDACVSVCTSRIALLLLVWALIVAVVNRTGI